MPPLTGRASTACCKLLYLDASITAADCAKAEASKLFKIRIRSAFLKNGYSVFFIYLFLFFKGDEPACGRQGYHDFIHYSL